MTTVELTIDSKKNKREYPNGYVQQLLIGLMLGFMVQMVLTVLTLGGHLIATGMGLGFASMVDPQNGVNVPVIGQFYVTLATLLFLVLNGHLMLISVLADSFHTMPVAVDGISRQSLWDVVSWASQMFAGGVLIALPAVTALLMTNIAFGVITRAAPQLHIFNVGFPVTLALGFIVIFISLPELIPQFSDILGEAFEVMKGLSPAGDAHGGGNYRGGISVGDCIKNAELVANKIISTINSP